MIKFISKIVNVSSPLSDPEGFTNNKLNKSLAANINKKLKVKYCSDHPTFENTILIDFKKDGNIMAFQLYSCDKFKQTLEIIAQNKNPYSSRYSQ